MKEHRTHPISKIGHHLQFTNRKHNEIFIIICFLHLKDTMAQTLGAEVSVVAVVRFVDSVHSISLYLEINILFYITICLNYFR